MSKIVPGSDPARSSIPTSHVDLAECPPVAALTTLMPDGSPQTSVVWCDTEGPDLRINTMRGFRKERNMRRDARVTLLCYDPLHPLRYLEVRGRVVQMTEDGAGVHLDALASKYAGHPVRYFGDCIPDRFRSTEVPVLCRVRPVRVVALDDGSAAEPPSPTASSEQRRPLRPAPDGEESLLASHLDLLERPVFGVLTTLLPGGQPHSCLVWVDHDGTRARVNTTLQRQSGRDLVRDRRLSLLIVDPADTARFIQIRGEASLEADGAVEQLDALTRRYTSHPRFYGYVYPSEQADRERRVMVVIHARRITLDAIHV